MNRRGVPHQHRRYSLPSTPTQLPLPLIRSIPEASGDFQKALEDLCTNEPNHGPNKSQVNTFGEFGYNGLNNIQELNESDYAESEEEEEEEKVKENEAKEHFRSHGRRHSSPSFFGNRSETDLNNKDKPGTKPVTSKSVVKDYNKLRKEYFIKHGHWPVSNGHTNTRLRPSSYHGDRLKHGSGKKVP